MFKPLITLSFLFGFCGLILAQDITVQGQVVDSESQIPIPGVNVLLAGTSNGVVTDFDGNYTISVPQDGVLVFSYVGYKSQEISVNGRSTINVSFETDTALLDEVVVVGFGTQKKSDVTEAASFVKMDQIVKDRPIVDATQALQGVAPGLQVVQSSGQPGDESTSINIRGFTSINGGSPLILINNVPGDLEDINPQDIESVTVLKDAAAASIYGSRAAFGVVLITLKEGARKSKVKMEYSLTTSISDAVDIPEKATTREFVEALRDFQELDYFAGQNVGRWLELLDAYDNDRSQLNLVSDPVSGQVYPLHYEADAGQYYPLADSGIIEDFIDNFGYSTIHNLTFSGGGDNVAYRLNAGYAHEDGVMVTDKDNFKKYNINANISADISPRLTSTSNVIFRSSVQSDPNARYDEALQLRMFDPTGFFRDEDGNGVLPFESPGNLVRFSVPTKRDDDNLRLFQKLSWNPFKNFTFNTEYTFEKNWQYTESVNNAQRYYSTFRFNPTETEAQAMQNSSLTKWSRDRVYSGINIYSRYNLDISNHSLSVLAGFNHENEKTEFFQAFRNDLIDPDTPTFNLATGENFGISDAYNDWAVVGYFGQLSYNYKNKYFFKGSLRYDGSSRFPVGNRYVLLPSFSAGWDISKEAFMDNVNWISLLKPRYSWGKIGNQGIPDFYPAIPGYESYRAGWIDPSTDQRYITFSPAQLVSPDFTWEEVVSSNYGIDIAFFNNRLNLSADYYERETLGMLREALPLPAILGTDAPLANEADLLTTGWEVEIGWRDSVEDFSYGLNVNVFDNQSEITKFDAANKLIGQLYEGRDLGEIWGYVTDGFYTADDFVDGTLDADLSGANRQLRDGVAVIENAPTPYPGDVKFKDLDGDGIITNGDGTVDNPGDQKVIGNTTRRYQFGVNGFIDYKGFDFSFVLSGVGKRDRWRSTGGDADLIWPFLSGFDHIYKHQLDYWTPDNQDAFYPRVYGDGISSNYGQSRRVQTKYLSDESYLRIQNITLGYTVQSNFLKKANINRVRVFIAGNNLFTFDNLPPGLDPDQGNSNAAIRNRYPIMAQYSLGFNISF